jgi:hypothetical protein
MAWYTFINHTSPHQPLGVPRGPRRELRVLARTPSSRSLVLELPSQSHPSGLCKTGPDFLGRQRFSLSSEIWCIGLEGPNITSFDSQNLSEPILSNNERSCFHRGQTLS